MKTEMPTSVRIGPHDYDICEQAPDDDANNADIDLNGFKICISPGLKATGKCEMLLHEAFHAMHRGSALKFPTEELEESLCEVQAASMVAFIRDNPQLIDYVQELLAPKKRTRRKKEAANAAVA